jgi:type II secretory pathway component PulM
MKTRLRALGESRAPRERVVAATLAALIGIGLYVLLVQSAMNARTRLTATVTALHEQRARLEQEAAELERVRAASAPRPSQGDLRALVQTQAVGAGLSPGAMRVDAAGADEVRVVLGAVAFSDWLAWVASLQSQKVRLDTCRIEALATPGLVSVTATFLRPSP